MKLNFKADTQKDFKSGFLFFFMGGGVIFFNVANTKNIEYDYF